MADIAELIVALKLRDGVSSGLGKLNGQLKGMQGGLSQTSRGIGQVGAGLSNIATRGAIAAAAGLGAVVTAAVSAEDAFAGVRKTVDASEAEFTEFNETLRTMARTIPVSFEELSAIAEQGGALGIAFDGLDEFTEVVAKLGTTTDLSTDAAATSLGVLGNVLQLSADDFDNFGSALVDLGNKGASTESQILGIAERAGAAGKLIGLSADQVLGFGSAAANMGIEVEAGGSALQKFFIDSLTAVEEGGEGLETFARTAGQTAEAFQTSFRKDAGGALTDFIEGLGELPQAVQIETLQDLGFNDVRITRLLLGLASDADNLTDSLSISATAFAENSALGEEAAKRYATTASQLKILKQNVSDVAVTIGNELLPIVGELTKEFVAFVNQPETQRGIREFAENLASGIRDFAAEVKGADFGPLLDTLKGAASIARGAFEAFNALPGPVKQLALAAIVANKVTGGAVGQIAGGLTNIAGGLLKIAFERGSSPANPLFVSAIGGGLGGGVGGAAGKAGGAGGLLRNALKLFPAVAAAALASEFEDEIQGFAVGLNQAVLKDLPTSGLGPKDLEWPFGPKNTPAILPEIFGGNGLFGGTPTPTKVISGPMPKVRDTGASSDVVLLREFGGKLDKLATDAVLEHLIRTNEIGLKGVGTTFQQGIADGLDPLGDTATRILARAEDPKAPPVMAEIKGHLSGLEEIQAQYLATGDVNLANKVQTNIDTLHTLIGTTDTVRAVTQFESERAASSDAALLSTASLQTAEIARNGQSINDFNASEGTRFANLNARVDAQKQAVHDLNASEGSRAANLAAIAAGQSGKIDTSNAYLAGINAKNFSPTINLLNQIRLSPTVIQQNIIQQATLSGNRIPGVQTRY